jgi:hypothetical protein
MPTTQQESGLWKRGLVLFALLAALAGVVLYALFGQPGQEVPKEALRLEPVVLVIGTSSAPLPAVLPWAGLYHLGDMLPSTKGWEIRYNATLALARRGSPHVRLDVLREMLDETRQLRNFRTQLQDGRDVPDETAARRTVVNALQAFRQWYKHKDAVEAVGSDNLDLQLIKAAIAKLAEDPNPVVRAEARETQLTVRNPS